ncbi:LTA synthase family protein [Leptothrix ochracea]|uniref:LTA synthase family protein n=1 Tax=Leptothrix ochracea TaxID=735331 RepID=UPI0034E29667
MRVLVFSFALRRSLHTLANRIGPGRMRALVTLLAVFIFFNFCLRLVLAVQNGDAQLFAPQRLIPALSVGALFDAGVASYFLAPIAWLLAFSSSRNSGSLIRLVGVLMVPVCLLWGWVACLELLFWHDHGVRFNMIVVEWLFYPHEAFDQLLSAHGSQTLGFLLGLGLGVAALTWVALMRLLLPRLGARRGRKRERYIAALLWSLAPVLSYHMLDVSAKDFSGNAALNELAANGYFELAHALRHSEPDYAQAYKTLPHEAVARKLALELAASVSQPSQPVAQSPEPLARDVVADLPGGDQRRHVVLVTLDGMGAEFVGALGDGRHLTPTLDALAADGLLFTRVYATSRRGTVGQEALTLSVPPSPSGRVLTRVSAAVGAVSLADVLRSKGYESLYFYAGNDHLGNMKPFFAEHGYGVVPLPGAVDDDELYRQVLPEIHRQHALGQTVLAQIMTRSMRGAGRAGQPLGIEDMVRDTDAALGRFMAAARQQAWFAQTIFVFVADRATASSKRGAHPMTLEDYRIPLLMYAPGRVQPGRVDTVASQIDVAPTVLALLNMSYRSHFFGQNILKEGVKHQRALLSDERTVGYYEDGVVVELRPNARYRLVEAGTGKVLKPDAHTDELLTDAISYYQMAAESYRSGRLRNGR